MSAEALHFEDSSTNRTCYTDWFWSVVWMLEDWDVRMLATIAFETECKYADDDYDSNYIDYIIPGDEGDIIVHKGDRYPLH